MCFINIFISNLRQNQKRYSRSQRVLHSLRKTLKHMTSSGRWVFRCAALWKRMCKKTETKQGQYVACTVQNMLPHEAYGCASWSPYIVAVMSGFILSLLPFVSRFYWTASSFPLFSVFISAIFTLLLPRNSTCVVFTHTKMQSLTEAIKGINRNSSNSRTMTVLRALNITASLHMAHHTL